jgi:two-component system sensor histidine kinase ChiS
MSFKILVVDDETDLELLINQKFRKKIKEKQLQFTFAHNGIEALEILKKDSDIDMILTDINMPQMDGLTLLGKINEISPVLRAVVVSAYGDMENIRTAMNRGSFDFLTKPVDFNDLEITINKTLSHVNQLKEALRSEQLARKAQEELNLAYSRFVPHEFLKLLGKESAVDIQLGDHIQKEMTIMFSDIRSFTSLSETMTPQENFDFLNSYLKRVGPIIRKNNGFIDKYVGDTIMALFHDKPENAISSAIEMRKELENYNEHRKKCEYVPIDIGIGIHTGVMILGTVGEEKRMEGTVISSVVNLASHIESLNKIYGAGIIVSEQTLTNVENRAEYNYRYLSKVQVKGKKGSTTVFEIFDGDREDIKELKLKTKEDFEKGLKLYYSKEFAEASVCFNNILAKNSQDKVANFYLKRSASYMISGVPNNWEGIESF